MAAGEAAGMIGSAGTFLFIFVAGVLATAVWRMLGLFLSSGLSEGSAFLEWVKAVSTALIAGLVARTVVFPPGALADIELPIRVGAFALGVAVYFLTRRHLGLGILSAASALILAHYALG
jgi:branched-subunit amino acid transport protein